jgi:thioredoxin reductase (NADPH)
MNILITAYVYILIEVFDTKPAILLVVDNPQMLKSMKRFLEHQYGKLFDILLAESGHQGLEIIMQLKTHNNVVALFIVDQRMPQMTGVEFLNKSMEVFPDAKRVLLTDYRDTDSIMQSINRVKIDYYLTKPCEPPEIHLYPALDDILEDWMSSYNPPFEGIKVIGIVWSPRSHEIKEFLARNGVPYQWFDIESDEARRLVSSINLTVSKDSIDNNSLHFPIILFSDGSYLIEPTNSQIAEKIGLKTHPNMAFYDLVIIGGGPAGLAAAVYGASEGLHTILIEEQAVGGQAAASSNIENYLGFPSGLTGYNLTRRAVVQAIKFGAEILNSQNVLRIKVDGQYRIATFADGNEIRCHVMLIACGVTYRKLNDVRNIEKLTGAGVYYGSSMVEALHYRGQDVYIVGGANSAGQAAIHFSKYARMVTLLVRSDTLAEKMSQYLIHQINETSNIKVRLNTVVIEVSGGSKLESIAVMNTKTKEQQIVPAAGLFIYIGAEPNTDWLNGMVLRDNHGFILTGSDLYNNKHPQNMIMDHHPLLLETNIPGIFAAGDVRHNSIKRIASAVGEGATAVQLIHQYLRNV